MTTPAPDWGVTLMIGAPDGSITVYRLPVAVALTDGKALQPLVDVARRDAGMPDAETAGWWANLSQGQPHPSVMARARIVDRRTP